jgi:hypothetical protein
MSLECLNDIITQNLAIQIDLTNLKSWDLNTGLTALSLTKWSGAITDNINLHDFGLTEFDNGRTNIMWSGITLTPKDNLFSMYRIGYNNVINPTIYDYSGVTATTEYLSMSAVTTGNTGNYFDLNGGYLQGFFKLDKYDYELFPSRYNNGITIETLINLVPESQGIFYMMGARSEDKYNTYFSGETFIINNEISGGVDTSENNYLNALEAYESLNLGFSSPESNMYKTQYKEATPITNIKNNVIAFEITEDKKIGYKYIDDNGIIITNCSSINVIPLTGWTLINITYTPDEIISDKSLLECAERRTGKLIFYVNGRAVWMVKEFPEFYFKLFNNDREKQIGEPFSISWGGGSFGLKHSYHYDYQTYVIYNGQDDLYVNNYFSVNVNPIPTDCYIPLTGDTTIDGLLLSVNDTKFHTNNNCNPDVEIPLTVMSIEYTGTTGNSFFIKFNQPISVISNRDYTGSTSIYVDGLFNSETNNEICLIVYSDDVDINIVNDIEYNYLLTGSILTGEQNWITLNNIFRTPDNSGQNYVFLGLLIETDDELISGGTIYVKDFEYVASDILVRDESKSGLLIEQNFDSNFIGGIQKLRLYDKALNSSEILHNAIIESRNDLNKNIKVSKGGRIIYR